MKPTPSQLTCIRDTFGIPCAVAAGAGSGKTATLTNRIVYALEDKSRSGVSDIDEILAITYTKKAANELKSRIRQALQDASQQHPELADQALKADGAWISTIHGMCARILKENALTLGLDPEFGILSEDLGQQLRHQAIEDTFSAHDSEDGIAGLFREYSRDDIAYMLEELMSLVSSSAAPASSFVTPPTTEMPSSFIELVSCGRRLYGKTKDKGGTKTLDKWNDQILFALESALEVEGADAVLAAPSPENEAHLLDLPSQEMLDRAARFPKIPGRVSTFKAQELCELADAYIESIARLRLAAAQPHLSTLLSLVEEAEGRFSDLKTQLGVLDNDDLLIRCAEALQDPRYPSIRARYRDRFKLVMVDEFQDTNQAQVGMINLVAGGENGALSPRMCVVGDAQQSIYRFRYADLSVFKNYVARVRKAQEQGCGAIVHLEENFRSNGEILAFCKGVFENTFGQDDYLELLHARDEELARNRTPFHGAESTDDPDPDRPRRINIIAAQGGRRQSLTRSYIAAAIARDLKALVDAGNKPGQMAVLLGSMSHAQDYAEALRAQGLPYAIAGGSVFNKAPEVKVIIDLAYTLIDPQDTTRAINVLTSPLFGLEAGDLLSATEPDPDRHPQGDQRPRRSTLGHALTEIFQEATPTTIDGRIDDLSRAHDWSQRLTTALKTLGGAALQVGYRPLSELVNEVLANAGWLSRADAAQQTRAGNVFKAIRILQGIEEGEQATGLTLARRLEERIDGLKEAPGVLAAAGDNFVRIMTIHASKGLQFPIVAVAETDSGNGGSSRLHTLFQEGKIYVALDAGSSVSRHQGTLLHSCLSDLRKKRLTVDGDPQLGPDPVQAEHALANSDAPDFLIAIDHLNAVGDAEEYQRKLYVAFTRSEDCLIVAQNRTSKGFRPGAPQMVERLLTGENGIAFRDDQPTSSQLFRIDTVYRAHPEQNLSWIARLETLNLKAKGFEDSASSLLEPESETHRCTARDSFPIPTARLSLNIPSFPYALQWSEGILSASALKHEHEEGAQRRPPQIALPETEQSEDAPASAPEKGTAFHSLGEYAAHAWRESGRIEVPPPSRIDAVARLHGLDCRQKEDLKAELARWTASPVAQSMARHAHLEAEVPFFIPLSERTGTQGPLTLNGFIDLLAYDTFGEGRAQVVDYKTGRSLATDSARRTAYELQAKCYAYALLLQGFDCVELDFVFVDQPDPEQSEIPSVTHFPPADAAPYEAETLRREIERAARTAGRG
ncbi:MAG: UvrD-helicase domain-containing protein [Eggerthellaceae bacterium]|jgi:ATP-dependent helicase/nuclease subunit A